LISLELIVRVPSVLSDAGYGLVLLGSQTICHHRDAQLTPIIFSLCFLLREVYARTRTFNSIAFIKIVYVPSGCQARLTVTVNSLLAMVGSS